MQDVEAKAAAAATARSGSFELLFTPTTAGDELVAVNMIY